MILQGDGLKPRKPIKVAVATQSISHFEVPLFRLIVAQMTDIQLCVFYVDKVHEREAFDVQYQQNIHWGESRLEGYPSLLCATPAQMRKHITKWMPDVVMIYGYAWPGAIRLILENLLAGIPMIHRGTLNYHKDPRQNYKSYLFRPFRNIIFRLIQSHHYGGVYSRHVLKNAGISDESMFFVPYSVDSPFFLRSSEDEGTISSSNELRRALKWRPEDPVILYIGQHNWIKGPDIAIEVFIDFQKIFPAAKFIIVGSGSMTREMKTKAEGHLCPDSYFFAGFIPSKKTVKYYLASDVVIFTSRYETWARAVNEAMLCKRPCITNNIIAASGGLVENAINGFVVDGLQPEAYVKALKSFFDLTTDKKELMGKNARIKAIEYSYEEHIDGLFQSIKRATQFIRWKQRQ